MSFDFQNPPGRESFVKLAGSVKSDGFNLKDRFNASTSFLPAVRFRHRDRCGGTRVGELERLGGVESQNHQEG